ncbi:hypothetical protein AVEN_181746-1, partial [Araneus ventricosus]
HRLEKHRQTRE